MAIVYLLKSPPTQEEYANFLNISKYTYKDEQAVAAGGYCPFFEFHPSEVFDFGSVVPGAGICHHPEVDTLNPACEGQYCRCPLSVEDWENAWTFGYIEEIES